MKKQEKEIEDSRINGEFIEVEPKDFEEIVESIKARQKNSISICTLPFTFPADISLCYRLCRQRVKV